MRWLTNFLHNLAVFFGRRTEETSSKLLLTGREMAMLACYDKGGFFTAHKDGSGQGTAAHSTKSAVLLLRSIRSW